MSNSFKWAFAAFVISLVVVIVLLYVRTEQLQGQVDKLQGQINTYRTLIFNLYGKNGG